MIQEEDEPPRPQGHSLSNIIEKNFNAVNISTMPIGKSNDNLLKETPLNNTMRRIFNISENKKQEFTIERGSWFEGIDDNVRTLFMPPFFKKLGIDNIGGGQGCLWLGKKKGGTVVPRYLETFVKGGEILCKYVQHKKKKKEEEFTRDESWTIMKRSDYLRIPTPKNNKCFYECMSFHNPLGFRVAFDIDGKNPNALELGIKSIRALGFTEKLAIAEAVGIKNKVMEYSYHIIIPTLAFKTTENNTIWKNAVASFPCQKTRDATDGTGWKLDEAIYRKNGAFRTLGMAKEKESGIKRRFLKVHKDSDYQDPSDFLMCATGDEENASKYHHLWKKMGKEKIKKINKKRQERGAHTVNTARFDYIEEIEDICPMINLRRDAADIWLNIIPHSSKVGHRLSALHFKMLCRTYKFWGNREDVGQDEHFVSGSPSWEGWNAWQKKYDKKERLCRSGKICGRQKWITKNEFDNLSNNKRKRWGLTGLTELIEQFYGTINDPYEAMKSQTIWNDDGDHIIRPILGDDGKLLRDANGNIVEDGTYFKADLIHEYQDKMENMKGLRKGERRRWWLGICCNMGSGKTYADIEWFRTILTDKTHRHYQPDAKILWITHRISMSFNLYGRNNMGMSEEQEGTLKELGFKNYKLIPNNKKKEENRQQECRDMVRTPLLICGIHSLQMLKGNKYDYVVIDENESIFNAFMTDACHTNYSENYWTFRQVIKVATGVFMMDAYMNKRTRKWIRMLDASRHTHLITRCWEKDKIVKKIIPFFGTDGGFPAWFMMIAKKLKEGKKCYVFYPFKTDRGNLQKLSMENFCKKLCAYAGLDMEKNVAYYHADIDGKRKVDDLLNVNKAWGGDVKLVVVNACITVGVNFDNPDCPFDCCFAGWACFLNPRDLTQALMRIRYWTEDEIYYVKFDSCGERAARQNKTPFVLPAFRRPRIECDKDGRIPEDFRFMRSFLETEYYSYSEDMVKHYFKKTGYIISRDWVRATKNHQLQYDDLSGNVMDDEHRKWEKIPEISGEEVAELVRKRNEGKRGEEISAKDGLKLQKFWSGCDMRSIVNDDPNEIEKAMILNWEHPAGATAFSTMFKRNFLKWKHCALRFAFRWVKEDDEGNPDINEYRKNLLKKGEGYMLRPAYHPEKREICKDLWGREYSKLISPEKPKGEKIVRNKNKICSMKSKGHRWLENGNLMRLRNNQPEVVVENYYGKRRLVFNPADITEYSRGEVLETDIVLDKYHRTHRAVKDASDNILKRQIGEAMFKMMVFKCKRGKIKFTDNFSLLLSYHQQYNKYMNMEIGDGRGRIFIRSETYGENDPAITHPSTWVRKVGDGVIINEEMNEKLDIHMDIIKTRDHNLEVVPVIVLPFGDKSDIDDEWIMVSVPSWDGEKYELERKDNRLWGGIAPKWKTILNDCIARVNMKKEDLMEEERDYICYARDGFVCSKYEYRTCLDIFTLAGGGRKLFEMWCDEPVDDWTFVKRKGEWVKMKIKNLKSATLV